MDQSLIMERIIFLFSLLLSQSDAFANHYLLDTIQPQKDSLIWHLLHEQQLAESQTILMNEQDRSHTSSSNIASPLYGEKDVFQQMAAFQFSAVRFRPRGYDGSFSSTLINGLYMNHPEDGNPGWSLWSGLQSVMRNSIDVQAFRFQENWFGDLGMTTNTDMRALSQRKQFQFGYAASNRTYANRYQLSYASDINRKGWAFAVSGNYRNALENYNTGCAYQAFSYYLAIDKQLNKAGLLSLIIFGALQRYGKQAAVVKPAINLFGRNYNPNWGYQQGEKRNAAMADIHKPVLILSHEWNPNNHAAWITSLGIVAGRRADTGLDWYQASDPRPDYYRYLPNYQTDSLLQEQVKTDLLGDVNLQQINWNRLYEVNRNSFEQINDADGLIGNTVSGKRAHYLLEERVTDSRRFLLSSHFQTRIANDWNVSLGVHLRVQRNHHYKKIKDLLGADLHVNWNQFAEGDLQLDPNALQYDLDMPNRILRTGDLYGYNYLMFTSIADGWIQVERKAKKLDYLFGIHFSKTVFHRKGLVRNGLFPNYSKGDAVSNHFFNTAFKTAITYKLNGYQSMIFSFSARSKAPLFDNVYISPKMRNTRQDVLENEKIINAELLYRISLSKVQLKLSFYHTAISNGMNVLTFYHDGYRNFVNYAISGIDKQHTGLEAGLSYSFNERWQWNLAFATGLHRYTSRQQVTVSLDNNEALLDKMEVYSKNFRIAGSPQRVLGTGLHYRTPRSFFFQLNWNAFDQQWIEFNPVRRTYEAIQGVQPGTDQWRKMIDQTMLPAVTTMNLFIGKGFKIGNQRRNRSMNYFCTVGINNLLNRKDIITGGYEQLRFDQETKMTDKFPPKYFYGYGINYAATISISF